MSAHRKSVTIAVLTYHRLKRLPLTISALLEQIRTLPAGLNELVSVDITVVDNAPVSEAQHITELAPNLITYFHEPTPGISAARNRALNEANDYEALIFVDDDVIPEQAWLEHMLGVWLDRKCQGVLGHMRSVLPENIDPWLLDGQFFHRPERATGTIMQAAASNNLLLDMSFIRKHQLQFSQALGQIGGEDSLITQQMVDRGGTILWCNEAKASDPVTADRATRGWVRSRYIRVGGTEALVALMLNRNGKPAATRLKFFVDGSARLVAGTAMRGAAMLSSSRQRDAKGARIQYRGFGRVMGAAGFAYYEYGRGKKTYKKIDVRSLLGTHH